MCFSLRDSRRQLPHVTNGNLTQQVVISLSMWLSHSAGCYPTRQVAICYLSQQVVISLGRSLCIISFSRCLSHSAGVIICYLTQQVVSSLCMWLFYPACGDLTRQVVISLGRWLRVISSAGGYLTRQVANPLSYSADGYLTRHAVISLSAWLSFITFSRCSSH